MRLILTMLLLAACPSPRTPAASTAGPASDGAPTTEAPDIDTAPTPPPPVPPPPVSPDGTVIVPCPPVSVPGMICVPGGPFVRGFDGEHSCDEYEVKWSRTNHNPAAEVWLSSYFLDREEVTYAAYQRCVEHGRCPPRVPNYVDFRRAALPMTGVSWFEARAYCEAQGKRLPTEAEFERAARGTEGRLHPWGDEPADCARAVIMDESGRGCGTPKAGSHPEKGRPLDVGSRPAIDGFTDLIGNAEEWVADWYLPYGECGDACLGTDPEGPCAGADTCAASKTRVVKGGSWYWGPACATGANRRHHFPKNSPYHHFGFRCAASLDAAALARPPEPRPEEAP